MIKRVLTSIYILFQDGKKDFKSPKNLFTELCSINVPIVFHNGLVDLIFIYENLYTSLPPTVAMFLADLVDLFPSGVIDTKYITDFEHMMQASYLEYVFRKWYVFPITTRRPGNERL